MSKSSAFRFVVADTKPRSEYWSLFTNGDDVYLTGNSYKRALKISLHKSGVCQIAMLDNFFSKHVKGKSKSQKYRDLLRWKRLTIPMYRSQAAVSILFAWFEFWPEDEVIPTSKSVHKISPPPDRHGQIINVGYSGFDPKVAFELGRYPDELLFSMQFPNKEYISVTRQIQKLSKGFFDFREISESGVLTLGIPPDELDDARGISVFRCMKEVEGCATIHSLHNMRFSKVYAKSEWLTAEYSRVFVISRLTIFSRRANFPKHQQLFCRQVRV